MTCINPSYVRYTSAAWCVVAEGCASLWVLSRLQHLG
jgi:hypothetical protein